MKLIDKERRLPKAEYERYRLWLCDYQPACQICSNKADDTHHVLMGAFNDDIQVVMIKARKQYATFSGVQITINA